MKNIDFGASFALCVSLLLGACQSSASAPITKNTPAFRASTLNPAYNFITDSNKGLKGVYCYIDQYTRTADIANFKRAGVNAFIVHVQGVSNETQTGFQAKVKSWKSAIGTAKLIMSIPFGSDEIYGNNDFSRYYSRTGKDINAPCPLDSTYWNSVYKARAIWAQKSGADGAVVDMEMYGALQTRYEGSCFCNDCWNNFCDFRYAGSNKAITLANRNSFLVTKNDVALYDERQSDRVTRLLGSIRTSITEQFMLGYVLYFEELGGITRGLGTSTAPALVFDEYTYPIDNRQGYDHLDRMYNWIGNVYDVGYPAIILPGVWPLTFTSASFKVSVDGITSITNKYKNCDGFWIWSSLALTYRDNAKADGNFPGPNQGYGCMNTQNPANYVANLATIAPKYNYYIGNKTQGSVMLSLNTSNAIYQKASRFQSNAKMTVKSITAYVDRVAGKYKYAVYSDSNGSPKILLGQTGEVTNPATGWSTLSLQAPVNLTGGTYYWLAIWSDTASDAPQIATEDSGGTCNWPIDSQTYGVWPSIFPANQQTCRVKMSIYAQ